MGAAFSLTHSVTLAGVSSRIVVGIGNVEGGKTLLNRVLRSVLGRIEDEVQRSWVMMVGMLQSYGLKYEVNGVNSSHPCLVHLETPRSCYSPYLFKNEIEEFQSLLRSLSWLYKNLAVVTATATFVLNVSAHRIVLGYCCPVLNHPPIWLHETSYNAVVGWVG